MIYYSQISQHTNTASPRLYLLQHIPGVDFALELTEQGWMVAPDWESYETGQPQPTAQQVLDWVPTQSTPTVSVIGTIMTGYAESEAARAERIKLLKSTASYALGSKIGAELAAANPPTNADEVAALKVEAKAQASALGGDFFDAYFSWIGAYREGGGPGFLAAVQADNSTDFLNWPTPAGGITLPDGTVILAEGGTVEDLFVYFLQ